MKELTMALGQHSIERLEERSGYGHDFQLIKRYLEKGEAVNAVYEESEKLGCIIFVPMLNGHFTVIPERKKKTPNTLFATSYHYSWFNTNGTGRKEDVKVKFVDYSELFGYEKIKLLD